MSRGPKVIVVTETWDGLGLAMLMERQGTEVLVAHDISDLKDPKDHDAAKVCGEGLVERMPYEKAVKQYKGAEAIWLFDNNSFPEKADALRKAGEQVLGTGALSAKMEKDRAYAVEVAEEAGFALPDSQEFSDVAKAVAYLEAHQDTAYVCKAQGGDADLTFVPMPSDRDAVANEMLRGYLAALEEAAEGDRPKTFLLQERISGGIEVNVDLWIHRGKPLVAFVDLEAKRRLNGDLGELVGCGFDYLFQVPILSPLVRKTAGRFLGRPELRNYTGSVDANVILKDGKAYWLEACNRLGYNATPTLFYGLASATMERILAAWLSGKLISPLFQRGYAASLSLFASEHQAGFPIIVPQSAAAHFCPYAAREGQDGNLAMVGGGKAWYAVGATVAYAPAAPGAGRRALAVAREIVYPNKGFRTDGPDDDVPTLPLARLRRLQAIGLLPRGAIR